MSLLVMLAAGCDLVDEFDFDGWESVERTNLGSVCLTTGAQALEELHEFTDDRSISAVVGRCFSGSCAREIEVELDADVDARSIDLVSVWAWEQPIPRNGVACTDDCNMPFADVELGTLAEGTYTVSYGDEQIELVIPSTDRACLGGFPFGQDAVEDEELL